jgi:hypothetical protein
MKHKEGDIWGYMMQINMIEATLTPEGEEQVAYLVFCKYASSVPRSEWKRCRREIEHQNNSRQPGRREGEVARGLVQKQRLYQIIDQPEHKKKIRKM